MEIIKRNGREEENPYSGNRYAIESILMSADTNEPVPGRELKLEEVQIDSRDDFIRISINIGKDNQRSLQSSKDFGNPFYTEKRLVML